jgi:hypothetical protein
MQYPILSPGHGLITECKYDLKVCDDGTLVQILRFWTLSIILSLSKTSSCLSSKRQRFGDWILLKLLSSVQSIEIVPISGHLCHFQEDG